MDSCDLLSRVVERYVVGVIEIPTAASRRLTGMTWLISWLLYSEQKSVIFLSSMYRI